MSRILVAGLGNPGPRYEHTRHNAGFLVVDRVARALGILFTPERRNVFQAQSGAGHFRGTPLILLKPMGYMNRSGEAVAGVMLYHKLSVEQLLVVHDDLDLDFGRIRFVRGGGAGGHNGVRSVIARLGESAFARLKIGIGRPTAPITPDKFVLSPFAPEEMPSVSRVIDVAAKGVLCFLEKGVEAAMNDFNSKASILAGD